MERSLEKVESCLIFQTSIAADLWCWWKPTARHQSHERWSLQQRHPKILSPHEKDRKERGGQDQCKVRFTVHMWLCQFIQWEESSEHFWVRHLNDLWIHLPKLNAWVLTKQMKEHIFTVSHKHHALPYKMCLTYLNKKSFVHLTCFHTLRSAYTLHHPASLSLFIPCMCGVQGSYRA